MRRLRPPWTTGCPSKAPENWHEHLIPSLAKVLHPRVYVELGLYQCAVFNRVLPFTERAIGVDLNADAGKFMDHTRGTAEFFNGTTDAFAATLPGRGIEINLLFIDADHSRQSVLTDFHNYFPFVADQGVILLHDGYPRSRDYTAAPFCGDGWKAIDTLSRLAQDYEMMTLPVHPGVTICRKRIHHLPWI